MADCTLMQTCIFFNDKMSGMPGMSSIYKQRYCKEDHLGCARYQVFEAVGREHVPADLFPNENDRAAGVISSVA